MLPRDYLLLLQMFKLFFSFLFFSDISVQEISSALLFRFLDHIEVIQFLPSGIPHCFWHANGVLSCILYSLAKSEARLIKLDLLVNQNGPLPYYNKLLNSYNGLWASLQPGCFNDCLPSFSCPHSLWSHCYFSNPGGLFSSLTHFTHFPQMFLHISLLIHPTLC